jgi:hypothetical protein
MKSNSSPSVAVTKGRSVPPLNAKPPATSRKSGAILTMRLAAPRRWAKAMTKLSR